jgi:hypothetical protein
MSARDTGATPNQPNRRSWAVTCEDVSGELETMIDQGVLMKRTDECLQSRDAVGSAVPVGPLPYNQEMLMGANHA